MASPARTARAATMMAGQDRSAFLPIVHAALAMKPNPNFLIAGSAPMKSETMIAAIRKRTRNAKNLVTFLKSMSAMEYLWGAGPGMRFGTTMLFSVKTSVPFAIARNKPLNRQGGVRSPPCLKPALYPNQG